MFTQIAKALLKGENSLNLIITREDENRAWQLGIPHMFDSRDNVKPTDPKERELRAKGGNFSGAIIPIQRQRNGRVAETPHTAWRCGRDKDSPPGERNGGHAAD